MAAVAALLRLLREKKCEYTWIAHPDACNYPPLWDVGRRSGGADLIFRQRTHLQGTSHVLKVVASYISASLNGGHRVSRCCMHTLTAHTNGKRSRLLKEMKAFASTKYRIAQSFFFSFSRFVYDFLLVFFFSCARATFAGANNGENTYDKARSFWWQKTKISNPILVHFSIHIFTKNFVPNCSPTEIGNDTIRTACFATSRYSFESARELKKRSDFNICVVVALVMNWQRWTSGDGRMHAPSTHNANGNRSCE